MSLLDQLASDAAAFFLMGDFEENVTYTPNGGTAITIPAVVFQEEPSNDRPETPRAKFHGCALALRNSTDPALGIASVDTDGDTVDVVLRKGEPATTCRVARILSVDEGVWVLEAVS